MEQSEHASRIFFNNTRVSTLSPNGISATAEGNAFPAPTNKGSPFPKIPVLRF